MDKTIIEAAKLCLMSYEDSPKGFIEVGDLRYGIFTVDNVMYVTFRGTNNLKNWLRDASVFPRNSPTGVLAHSGFVRAYYKLREKGLLSNVCKSGRVIAIGHSLGGAIATQLAEEIKCELITFGCPKVYFRFSTHPILDHIRIVNDDDPVPWIPGIMYTQSIPATLEMTDNDIELVDVKDHSMQIYWNRIQRRI